MVDGSGNTLLVVDLYCWVRQFDGPRLLVWYQTKVAAVQRQAQAPALHLHVFDVNGLCPLPNSDAACRELDAGPESVLWAGGHLDHRQLPVSLPAGTHEVDLPAAIRKIGELFVLLDAAPPRQGGAPSVRLWVVRPSAGTLQVIPQDWFNTGGFDFDYQWIARVARDPSTGRLVGEGIRLQPFALDETGTQLAEWLTVDPFEPGSQ